MPPMERRSAPDQLDQRAQVLLKTLIERYIAEGQPVGSRALSKFSGLDLSPATVRRAHDVVHAALAHAVARGWLGSNPASACSPPTSAA